jgi:hypothetical protein
MPNTLEFPDGVRLARLEELPGPEPDRYAAWAHVQSAHIAPGYTIVDSNDPLFSQYAEINVNACHIWPVFCDLCQALLGPVATLVGGMEDDEPVTIGSAEASSIIAALERHKYQLAHDGFLQFGLVSDQDGEITEVFVAPTKHFKVWLNDEKCFRSIMDRYQLSEQTRLEFLDQYPRTTVALAEGPDVFRDHRELLNHLSDAVNGLTRTN